MVDRSRAEDVVVEEGEGEGGPPHERRHLHAVGARVGGGVAALSLALAGAGDGVSGQAGAEVQLGPLQLDRLVGRPVVLGDPARRRHHDPAPAGVDQVAALPALVGDVVDVELAGRDQHLLAEAVDLVAVDVEVVDRQTGLLALVDAEARQHLARVEQADVLERRSVAGDLLGVESPERDVDDLDVLDAHRRPRGKHVAGDVRALARLLVRVDDEALDRGGVDVAADEQHDQPEARGEQGQAERARAQHGQEQPCREQRDEQQQHQRGQLGVDDRVRRPLHEAPSLVRRLVAAEPVVGRLERGQHGEEHGDVTLGRRAHGRYG